MSAFFCILFGSALTFLFRRKTSCGYCCPERRQEAESFPSLYDEIRTACPEEPDFRPVLYCSAPASAVLPRSAARMRPRLRVAVDNTLPRDLSSAE
ncbi:hypothetical protein LOC54_00305 [Acetobacter sp. AN02]|uniref:hypothetical protein n=1 Tax=Acetobacter sp. AN02 TaxID=2894186 RepID=UPI0024343F3B|nr:hypothetical protein [Acetobacter sp. AN02]MDG6093565.1 hypothetical protein [Acetobacter sp. AN02]